MLQAIRDKAQGVFAWAMLILVGIPFALWGIQNYFDSGKERAVAEVGGHEIFERDVNRAYEGMLSSIGGLGQYDESQIRQEALNKLINDALVADYTQDHRLVVGDNEVRAFVHGLPYFQTDAHFDKEKYKQALNAQGATPAQFAAQIRAALIQEQIQRGISDSAFVTHRQLEEFYRLRNQSRRIEYLSVPLQKEAGTVGDDEIAAYYQQHQMEFVTPEKVAVQYLSITLDEVATTVQVGDEDLKSLYEEQKKQLDNNEMRKVSHILIESNAAPDSDEDKKAKEKADALYRRIANGEDFARLAKELSDDKVSAEKGGDLGSMNRDGMERNFADMAFKLEKNQVSTPVKTSFGYHLIRVTEIIRDTLPAFETMRPELAKNFQRSSAENRFYEMGQTLTEQAFEHPDSLETVAATLNLKIQETPLFAQNETGNGILAEQAVRDAAFSEEVLNGKNSEAIELGAEKVVVLRVKTHSPSTTRALADVRTEIIARLSELKRREQTRNKANALFEQSKQGVGLAALAKTNAYTVVQSPDLQRSSKELALELIAAAFKAPRPSANSETAVIQVAVENGDQILFRLIAVNDGELSKVDAKEQEMAGDYLQKKTAQNEYEAWIDQLREKSDVNITAKKE